MTKPTISEEGGATLVRWARRAVEAAVRGERPFRPATSEITVELSQPLAVFVTLKKRGELRGCIGQMNYDRPLWENLLQAAIASALDDPRFSRVEPSELGDLTVEVSVLSRPDPIADASQFDASRHGIIVQRGWSRALLLPKVAEEYGWDEEQVLRCVCQKAGLDANAWREAGTQLEVFTALDFSEHHPATPA
jgi:AmmeMemoRadiSam system protein A